MLPTTAQRALFAKMAIDVQDAVNPRPIIAAHLRSIQHELSSTHSITHKVGRSGIWWSKGPDLLGHLQFDATLCDKCGYGLGNPTTCASCQRAEQQTEGKK